MLGRCDACNIPAPEHGSHYLPCPTNGPCISSIMRLYIGILLVIASAACGPELTTPSDKSLAGTWRSEAHVFTLSSFRMQIVQEPGGIVSGTWSAHGDGGRGCPEHTPCEASGSLIGRNNVAQVQIELIGSTGRFEGVQVKTDELRGIFAVGDGFEVITFTRGSGQ